MLKSFYITPEEILAGGNEVITRTRTLLENTTCPTTAVNFICKHLLIYIIQLHEDEAFKPSKQQIDGFQNFLIQDFVCLETTDMVTRTLSKRTESNCKQWLLGNDKLREKVLNFLGLKETLEEISGVNLSYDGTWKINSLHQGIYINKS